MAKIKFGMMMTDARGKLGGQVFSKNRSGAYVRTKVTPLNPQTQAQAQVRSNLATLSSGWSYLTPEQIAGYNNAVEEWQSTDIFGDIKKPTGKNLFVKLGLNCLNNELAVNNSVPQKIELPAVSEVSATYEAATNTLSILNLPVFASGKYQIEATPSVASGVSFVKNRFRVISSITHDVAGTIIVTSAYQEKFGSLMGATKFYLRIRAIGSNGQAGTPIVVLASFI